MPTISVRFCFDRYVDIYATMITIMLLINKYEVDNIDLGLRIYQTKSDLEIHKNLKSVLYQYTPSIVQLLLNKIKIQ